MCIISDLPFLRREISSLNFIRKEETDPEPIITTHWLRFDNTFNSAAEKAFFFPFPLVCLCICLFLFVGVFFLSQLFVHLSFGLSVANTYSIFNKGLTIYDVLGHSLFQTINIQASRVLKRIYILLIVNTQIYN